MKKLLQQHPLQQDYVIVKNLQEAQNISDFILNEEKS